MLLLLVAVASSQAQVLHTQLKDSAAIHFSQSKWNLDPSLGDNASVLDSIRRKLTVIQGDSIFRISHVNVIGGASPEGSEKINRFLSEKRAATLFDRFRQYSKLDDADLTFTYLGRDWEGVLNLAVADTGLPFRDETLALLGRIASEKRLTGKEPANSLSLLKQLCGGVPYRYLYVNIFPEVRASKIIIDYTRTLSPAVSAATIETMVRNHIDSVETSVEVIPDSVETSAEVIPDSVETSVEVIPDSVEKSEQSPPTIPFRGTGGLRTNLLYDALALPNIGIEFYLGRNYSIGANWMYGWWSRNVSHFYWRAYGGELFARWWFGKLAHRKPLTGFHAGIYAQYYMYDFELGGKGEMAGKPEDNLWNQGMYGGGVEFGFSFPIKKRLNIDLTLGIGYSGGEYHKYIPIDTHYVWQGTYRRNYVGPTKAEVALVWLIGPGNTNEKPKTQNAKRKEVPND